MKKILLILSGLLLFSFTFQKTSKEEARERARTQITSMKDGIMLVRLNNKRKVVEALEEKGMKKRATLILKKQKMLNDEIIGSFKGFTFCKVYFFFSDESQFLVKGEYEKVNLFSDTNFKKEKAILSSNFFVADFGYLPGKEEARTENKQPKQTGIQKNKQYKGTDVNTKIKCMYLRDNKLNRLDGPLPYYVRFHPTPLNQLTYSEVVTKMNNQLFTFHSRK